MCCLGSHAGSDTTLKRKRKMAAQRREKGGGWVREERGRGGEVHTQVLEQFQMINCSRRIFSLYLLFNTLTHFSPGAPDVFLGTKPVIAS